MKKYKNYIYAILIPLFIMLIYMIWSNNFNLSDNILINDLSTQYASLIKYFKSVLLGNDSFFYSFSKGIGGNMISTIAYYLLSPLNVLALFLDNVNIAVAIGIVIKFCLADLTMYIYLSHKFKTDKKEVLIFSTIYAFSGYMVNYYFNIMWIDILVILPLILKSIDQLLEKKKSFSLPIFISLSIILNFYISYMALIFIVLYFIYEMLLKYDLKKDKVQIKDLTLQFILSLIISLLISAFILLPTIIDMKNNMFRYSINTDLLKIDFSKLGMMISKLLIGSFDKSTRYSPNESNIYITIFGLVLVIKYFLNSKISKKEKILSAIGILIFTSSICFGFFNLIWHGFSFPNGYNYRFSFLFSIFLIIISYKQYRLNEKLSLKKILLLIITFSGTCLLLIGKYKYLSTLDIGLSIILFIIYLLLLNKTHFKIFLLFLVLVEITINFNLCFLTAKKLKQDTFVYDYREDICSSIRFFNNKNRVSLQSVISANDGFFCNIKDTDVALTTNNQNYYQFMAHMGYPTTYSTIVESFTTGPLIDDLLGVEYALRFEETEENYKELPPQVITYNNKPIFLYFKKNEDALSLGYIVENKNMNYTKNAFENQNELAKKISGLDINIWEQIPLEKIGDLEYSFQAEKESYYFYNYFPIAINSEKYIKVVINNSSYNLNAFSNGITIVNNTEKKNQKMKIKVNNENYKQYINPQVYTLNEENYQKIIEKIKQKELKIEDFNKNQLIGTIELEKEETLMLSIPYEKGWHIKVNGKKVNYQSVYDTFISLDLSKGKNKIEMTFIPPGLEVGIFLSLLGIILLIIGKKRGKI